MVLLPRPEQFLCSLAQCSRGSKEFAYRDDNWTVAFRRRFRQLPQGPQVMGQFIAMMRSIQDIRPEEATALLRATLDPSGCSLQDAWSNKIGYISEAGGLVRTCIAAGANLEDPVIIWYATISETHENNTLLVYRAIEESGVDIAQIKIPGHNDEDGCPDTCPGESLLHQATIAANNPPAVEYLLATGADPVAFLESYRDCQGRPAADGYTFQPPFNEYSRNIWVAFQRAGANLQPLLDNLKLHAHLKYESPFYIRKDGRTVDDVLNSLNSEKLEGLSIIRFIMDLGINLNSPDQEGDRLLHIAVKRWIHVEEDSNKSRQKNDRSENYAVPAAEQLRFQVWYWMEFIQLLIARGADATLTDAADRTARQLAEESPLLPRCGIEEAFAPPAGRTIEAPDNPRALKRAKLDKDVQE